MELKNLNSVAEIKEFLKASEIRCGQEYIFKKDNGEIFAAYHQESGLLTKSNINRFIPRLKSNAILARHLGWVK